MHQNCLDVQMINHKTLGLVQLMIVGLQPTFRKHSTACVPSMLDEIVINTRAELNE